ncbi:uncharacterized protein LOC121764015 [Salvia splendens]|uniref:uncharacterized protein LOC121764015 n=1 Tax=Salvia splendens TaxID=180675 RepID=UPI001C277FB3|nr:uncharacterized protein LOC121764015 [Salvia splendens]
MGCFPACFGHVRSDLATKKCLSQDESVKFLPEKTESMKVEETVDPIKLASQLSEDISKEKEEEETVCNHSNVKKISKSSSKSDSTSLVECGNGKVEMERGNEREDQETSSHVVQEESCCSSLFTLSIDSRKHFLAAEMGEKEVSSLLKTEDPMIKQCFFDKSKSGSDSPCRGKGDEKAVEMSLSSWLAEKSPQNSPESENNYGDRLRVIAEISKLNGVVPSTTTSCCSGGDDQLGVGTVGRYWQQRGAVGEAEDGEVSSSGKC